MQRHTGNPVRGCPQTSANQEPRQMRPSNAGHFVPRSQSQAKRQRPQAAAAVARPSAGSPIASISTDPTRYDRAGRTHSPSHGDALRPNAAYPAVHNVLRRITAGQRVLASRYVTLRLRPAGATSPWLVS